MPDEFDFDAAMRAKGLDDTDPAGDVGEEATQSEGEQGLDAQSALSQIQENQQTAEEQTEEADDRPRNEKGQFVKAEDELILGKFKSTDDLVEAYKNLEQQQGRAGNDLGELKAELEELRAELTARDVPQQQYVDNTTIEALDQWAEDSPHEAAMWAVQNQQPRLYERVMETWFENDARSASRFETALAINRVRQEVQTTIAPTAQTVEQNRTQEEFNHAWASVAEKYPDMMKYADTMLTAAESAPELVMALQSGDAKSKERTIENLYYLTKGRQADTVSQATDDLGRQAMEQEQNDKLAATVASASSSPVREEGKGDLEDWKKQVFLDEPSTSISRFFNPKT